jgi:two-component system, LytTR family, sensor kinase
MGVKLTRIQVAAAVLGLFLLNGGLVTMYQCLRAQLYHTHAPSGGIVINEMSGAMADACFFSVAVYLLWKRASRASGWRTQLGIHGSTILVYSALHTTAYWGMRSVLYPLLGYGEYNVGNLAVRYAMELPNDVLTYAKWLLFFLVFQYYRRLRDRDVAAAALERSLAEARLRNLQAQMQPHFLMNALNAITSMIYEDPKAADEMIARLGAFLRRLLSAEQNSQISLAQELDSVQAYIDIMQMRYQDRLKYHCDIEPSVDTLKIPPLSLQPLVENSIIHGMNPVDFSVDIDITARRCGDRVELTVRDHGKGFCPGPTSGLGLQNLRNRLATLYGDRQAMQVELAEGGGTVVRLLIPQNG